MYEYSVGNCLLVITGRIHDYIVSERVTLNFSPALRLVRSVGRRSLRMLDQNHDAYARLEDISSKMKTRALNDYGLKVLTVLIMLLMVVLPCKICIDSIVLPCKLPNCMC
jgi:hypothetical protein